MFLFDLDHDMTVRQCPRGAANDEPVPLPKLIGAGRRAGQRQDMNDVAMTRLAMTKRAVILLKREGLTVIDMAPMRGLSPRIQIEADSKLWRLLDDELAVEVRRGVDRQGIAWRDYEFKCGDCRVFWQERGQS